MSEERLCKNCGQQLEQNRIFGSEYCFRKECLAERKKLRRRKYIEKLREERKKINETPLGKELEELRIKERELLIQIKSQKLEEKIIEQRTRNKSLEEELKRYSNLNTEFEKTFEEQNKEILPLIEKRKCEKCGADITWRGKRIAKYCLKCSYEHMTENQTLHYIKDHESSQRVKQLRSKRGW